MLRTFADRLHAGRVLAGHLAERDLIDPVVLALPRGGVCVAVPVAEVLGAPLEVLVARKLGTPGQRELAIGAIAEDGPRLVDEDLQRTLRVSADVLDKIEAAERTELERRVRRYRRGRELPILEGRDVVLVDDGLATGLTALAALRALAGHHPRSVVVAVPVGPALDGHAPGEGGGRGGVPRAAPGLRVPIGRDLVRRVPPGRRSRGEPTARPASGGPRAGFTAPRATDGDGVAAVHLATPAIPRSSRPRERRVMRSAQVVIWVIAILLVGAVAWRAWGDR